MNINVNFPDTIDLGRPVYHTLHIAWDKVPLDCVQHIINTYVPQVFTDAANAGGKYSTDLERIERATKKLDAFYNGTVRIRRVGVEPTDPVENRAWKIAKAKVRELATATPQWKDKKIIGDSTGDDKLEAVLLARVKMMKIKLEEDQTATEYQIDRYLTAHPDVRVQARIAVEAEKAGKSNDFDL